jgi:hypothetical protein
MLFLTTSLLLTLNCSADPSAVADSDHAATLLSRFQPGAMPKSAPVLTALAQLNHSGTHEHIPLLQSLVDEERPEIRESALAAISNIATRHRASIRGSIRGPTSGQMTAWLTRYEPTGAHGEELGRFEKEAIAYCALLLGDRVGVYRTDWKAAAYRFEQEGQFKEALRLYAAAVLHNDLDAIDELEEFRLDTELLTLGLLTALPHDHPSRHHLMRWLIHAGSLPTVRIMAERAKRGPDVERALALDSLALMIRTGKLKPSAINIARNRLERSTQDPSLDVSQFARTTLSELESTP